MRHRDFVTRSEPYSRLSHGAAPRYNICANPLFFAVRHQGSGTNGRSDIPPCVPLKLSICVGAGHLLVLRLSEGQMSDFKGAALMVKAIPDAQTLLGDEEYDADWFRHALPDCGITSCIPRKSNRKMQIAFDRTLYKSRHKIGTMFCKLKDWRPIHTTTGTCAHAFISAIVIAVTIIFRINQCGLGLVACHRGSSKS